MSKNNIAERRITSTSLHFSMPGISRVARIKTRGFSIQSHVLQICHCLLKLNEWLKNECFNATTKQYRPPASFHFGLILFEKKKKSINENTHGTENLRQQEQQLNALGNVNFCIVLYQWKMPPTSELLMLNLQQPCCLYPTCKFFKTLLLNIFILEQFLSFKFCGCFIPRGESLLKVDGHPSKNFLPFCSLRSTEHL